MPLFPPLLKRTGTLELVPLSSTLFTIGVNVLKDEIV